MVWHVALHITTPYGDEASNVDLDFELQRMWAQALEPIAIAQIGAASAPTEKRSNPLGVMYYVHDYASND